MNLPKQFYIFLLVQFMLLGCSASRFQKRGDIINKNYHVEIPFQYEHDMILVDVIIEGSSYTFMWDTGAELNVIDQTIADGINVKSIGHTRVTGSDKTSKKMGQLAIPSFYIGPLEVQESVAVISDFAPISRFLGCLEIQGIIGNNVMRKANMQIDYERQIITMTDSNHAFYFNDDAHTIKMNSGKIGNVKLKMIIAEEEQYVTFDTGYGGKIKSNKSLLLADHPNITSHGITGASLHSVNRGSVTDILIGKGDLAGIPFHNQIITLNESGSSLLGNRFLNHFTITAEWDKDQLTFDPIKTMNPDTIDPFELKITPNFTSLEIEIAKLYKDYSDFSAELIGWQVDKVNELKVKNANLEQFCAYWDKLSEELKLLDEFDAEISKDEASKTITIKRVKFDHTKVKK